MGTVHGSGELASMGSRCPFLPSLDDHPIEREGPRLPTLHPGCLAPALTSGTWRKRRLGRSALSS